MSGNATDHASAPGQPESATTASCTQGDLEYVTQRVMGAVFGGWYRVLSDQRLELLALGCVWKAPRNGSSPERQARAMLAKLARMRRPGCSAPRLQLPPADPSACVPSEEL
jgi:hypothetical protein